MGRRSRANGQRTDDAKPRVIGIRFVDPATPNTCECPVTFVEASDTEIVWHSWTCPAGRRSAAEAGVVL